MAKGKKTGGNNIKPGEVRNPNGRPKLPEHVKKARSMNKAEFTEILNKYMMLPLYDLEKHIQDIETPAVDLIVLKMLWESIKKGDEKKFAMLLDRWIGKVKEEVHHSGSAHSLIMEAIRKNQPVE